MLLFLPLKQGRICKFYCKSLIEWKFLYRVSAMGYVRSEGFPTEADAELVMKPAAPRACSKYNFLLPPPLYLLPLTLSGRMPHYPAHEAPLFHPPRQKVYLTRVRSCRWAHILQGIVFSWFWTVQNSSSHNSGVEIGTVIAQLV
jgi:hypothetical protein